MKRTFLPLFKRKFFKPCKKLFKFKLRRPLLLRSHQFSHCKWKTAIGGRCSMIRSFFHSPRQNEGEMDSPMEPTSFSDTPHHLKAPHPSPLTPAAAIATHVRMSGDTKNHEDEAEDACRSFNKYLLEMVVEEGGKMRDLGDVEELLYCWNNLNSPVFIDLVCRFYRELCKDLFSNTHIQKPHRFLRY